MKIGKWNTVEKYSDVKRQEAIIYEINLHVYNYIKTNKLLKLKETGFKSLAIPYPG